jgi:7-keto-8-aminopelargonate synthetase-like enzyme
MVQQLSSSGYVFSASLPPYLASAAITAVDYLEANSSILSILRANIATLLSGIFYTCCSFLCLLCLSTKFKDLA